MSVRSVPATNGEPAQDLHAPFTGSVPSYVWLTIALLAVAFALPGWLVGARLTLAGWLGFLGGLAGLFGAPLTIALPAGLITLLAALGAGCVYSLAEIGGLPVRRVGKRWVVLPAFVWLVYLFTMGTDWATTAYGLLRPDLMDWPAAARPFLQWVAADVARVGVVTLAVTHYPELLIVGAAYALRQAWRRLSR